MLKKIQNKKGQIASLDIILGAVILMLIIGIIIIMISSESQLQSSNIEYGGEIFTIIEQINTTDIAFLNNYHIDNVKLDKFTNNNYDYIKKQILTDSYQYNLETNEVCMFFLNSTTPVYINGSQTEVGHSSCSFNNPCGSYLNSYVYIKPVLFNHDLINFYVVVCE